MKVWNPEMNILFFGRGEAAEGIQEAVEKLSVDMEIYRNVGSLIDRFRHPLDDPTIAVLVADNREGLEELLVFRDVFRSVRIILVLPDRGSQTISKGHQLHARFLTFTDSNPVEVALVLGKMVEKANCAIQGNS